MLAGHLAGVAALGGLVAEVAPAVDDLLGRTAADAQLEAAAGDEVGCARRAGVLGHVQRVLVAHVDRRRCRSRCGSSCAPIAASSGNGEASWRAKWWTRK